MKPWPKLFHNLRASRETELAESFPLHVVCAWIGNSQPIAAKHYLQVTDEHFERAVGADAGGAGCAARNPAQQPHANTREPSQEPSPKTKNPTTCGAFHDTAAGCDNPNKNLIPPRGLEPLSSG